MRRTLNRSVGSMLKEKDEQIKLLRSKCIKGCHICREKKINKEIKDERENQMAMDQMWAGAADKEAEK